MAQNKEALIEMKAVTIAWYEKKSLAARATSKNKLLNLLNNFVYNPDGRKFSIW